MEKYIVGGAVRDMLLGREVADRDWVVIGESPESMAAAGFAPVGIDFPVFLHPDTHEEHALARSERKTAPGYAGFVFHTDPSVTLEEDLWRRDLTINAMALKEDGSIVDPHGGQVDLAYRTFRHVSSAFAEDPVRILRLARFAARYPDFKVAPETLAIMQGMVAAGEVDALVSERVWQELSKGLMEARPSRMLEVLRDCGALAKLLPEVAALENVPQPPAHHPEVDTFLHVCMVLDMSARLCAQLAVRYSCLMHDLGKGTTPAELWPKHHGHELRSAKMSRKVSSRLKVPVECKELADVVAMEHGNVHASLGFGAGPVVRLLERCDAIRRPERFALALLACECDARGRTGFEDRPYPQRERLIKALEVVSSVDTAAEAARVVALGRTGPEIGEAIHSLRIRSLVETGFSAVPPKTSVADAAAVVSASNDVNFERPRG